MPLFKEEGHQPECRVIDELRLLFEISYTLESSLELREVIRPVLTRMSEVLGMRRGAITILQRGQVTISEAVGLPKDLSKEDYLAACHEVIGVVTETGQAVVAGWDFNKKKFASGVVSASLTLPWERFPGRTASLGFRIGTLDPASGEAGRP